MHNINYWVYDENCNRKSVLSDIESVAECEGDGYSGPLKWHDSVQPLKNQKEAEDWIKEHDTGWYDDHAVRFYDFSDAKETKKMIGLKQKAKEISDRLIEFEKEHSVTKFKAEHIGCSNCGSNVARKFLHGERCPVCGADLRSESTLKKIKDMQDKVEQARKDYREEGEKQTGRAKVKWLVKFEYHS